MFGLFSAAVTSALTVVVVNGGPAADSEKLLNISTIRNSAEKHVVVTKLSNRFNMNTEYDTVEDLVSALKSGNTDSILLDMYVLVKRRDLFNDTSWLQVVDIVNKGMAHGIELRGISMTLAEQLEEIIQVRNVQTEFLEESHKNESEEEHEGHTISETEEESSLVFFEPESPFFLLTLQVGGAALGVFIACGIIIEVYQRKGRKMVQTGRQCQDEDDMRKLVEDFYRNFTRTYKVLRKKNKNLIKLNKKSNHFVKKELDSADLW